jgi:hypothetical protein
VPCASMQKAQNSRTISRFWRCAAPRSRVSS